MWKRINRELEEKPMLWGIDSKTGKPRKGPSPDDIVQVFLSFYSFFLFFSLFLIFLPFFFLKLPQNQGEVGDCWLLGAMAALATKPDILKHVFPDKQDWHHGAEATAHPGVFLFRFFKWGEWVEVLIDDRLPVKKSMLKEKQPPPCEAFAYSRLGPNRAYWPLLFEKAYAKLHGSYASLAGGHASDAFVDFTGGVCANVVLKPYTDKQLMVSDAANKKKKEVDQAAVKQAEGSLETLWKRLKSANKSDRLISASISAGGGKGGLRSNFKESCGLVLGHAYSVLDVKTIKEKGFMGVFSDRLHLVKLRNPWGDSEWTGTFFFFFSPSQHHFLCSYSLFRCLVG